MATLDSFREATGEPIQLDLANGYIADIRLNAGDINGRTITVELTDNGTPITDTTGITVALAYNTSPGSGLGDRVSMPAVFGTTTATYRVAVPRKALQHAGAILMGIEVSVNGTRICSRNFHGIVERAVFDATTAINKAVSAAGEAKDAADAARTSVIEYRQLSDDCKAKIAASAAAGVVFATQSDIDAQYDTVIAPALSDAETIPPLTQSDIDWALDIINR